MVNMNEKRFILWRLIIILSQAKIYDTHKLR